MDEVFSSNFQLLEGGEINDASGTPIFYQDSSSVEPFYHEHDD